MQRYGERSVAADEVFPLQFHADAPAFLGDFKRLWGQSNYIIAGLNLQGAFQGFVEWGHGQCLLRAILARTVTVGISQSSVTSLQWRAKNKATGMEAFRLSGGARTLARRCASLRYNSCGISVRSINGCRIYSRRDEPFD
jgi:hypothetical protein